MPGQKRVEDARKRAYDPGIHLLCKKVFTKADGLHRNSGLPELRNFMRRKTGKPDLRCQSPAMTADRRRLLATKNRAPAWPTRAWQVVGG
jgi:hypothetical protein